MGEVVTLNLPESVAKRAHQVATQTQRRVEDVLVEWLDQSNEKPFTPSLPQAEAEFLQNINLGFSEAEWQRYHALVAKRRAEELTTTELQELIAFSDQLEDANTRRVSYLIGLARLQSTSVENLMRDLGITTPAYV